MIRRNVSRSLFDARWIMAPFYFGLVVALLLLLFVFLRQLLNYALRIAYMGPADAVLMALSLIDLSLVANLLLIVTLAGYENFVTRIDSGGERRPQWMGMVDFAAMKNKLMGSIIAISAIALLRIFMKIEEGSRIDPDTLRWMAGIHGMLLLSALVLAVTERLARHRLLPPPEPPNNPPPSA
ncbi:YqhA family protein [Stenotrophomonas sp. NPDC077464]|uniref:YqhA family protein n=1 Tax=unclassified Stenotrophomonas TaxID=196198 RepID=UPI0037CDDDED